MWARRLKAADDRRRTFVESMVAALDEQGQDRLRYWPEALMPIVVRLDVMLALRKKRSKDLAAYIGITESNLSLFKAGRVKVVRLTTLEKICEFLECQPGDILAFDPAAPDPDEWAGKA